MIFLLRIFIILMYSNVYLNVLSYILNIYSIFKNIVKIVENGLFFVKKKYSSRSPILILKKYLISLLSFLGYVRDGFSFLFLFSNNKVKMNVFFLKKRKIIVL